MLNEEAISPYSKTTFIIPLAAWIIVYWIKEAWLNFIQWKSDQFINNQLTKKLKEEKGGEVEVKWNELKLGNIILLQKGEMAPADLLVLDTSEIKDKEAICYLNTQKLDGKLDLTRKKAIYLTQLVTKCLQKGKLSEYRKILTGKVEYESGTADFEQFNGFFRLKKDPKVEQCSHENLIPRGAALEITNWIIGLVVFTGSKCKIMKNLNFFQIKQSQQQKISSGFFFQFMTIYIIVSLLIGLLLVGKLKIQYQLIETKFSMGNLDNYRLIMSQYLLFATLIPVSLNGIQDLISIFRKVYLEKKFFSAKQKIYQMNFEQKNEKLSSNPNAKNKITMQKHQDQNQKRQKVSVFTQKPSIPNLNITIKEEVGHDLENNKKISSKSQTEEILNSDSESQQEKVKNVQNNYVVIQHPEVFTNLGHVEYVFLDKTGTLTYKLPQIHSIYYNNKLYNIREKQLVEKVLKNRNNILNTQLSSLRPAKKLSDFKGLNKQ